MRAQEEERVSAENANNISGYSGNKSVHDARSPSKETAKTSVGVDSDDNEALSISSVDIIFENNGSQPCNWFNKRIEFPLEKDFWERSDPKPSSPTACPSSSSSIQDFPGPGDNRDVRPFDTNQAKEAFYSVPMAEANARAALLHRHGSLTVPGIFPPRLEASAPTKFNMMKSNSYSPSPPASIDNISDRSPTAWSVTPDCSPSHARIPSDCSPTSPFGPRIPSLRSPKSPFRAGASSDCSPVSPFHARVPQTLNSLGFPMPGMLEPNGGRPVGVIPPLMYFTRRRRNADASMTSWLQQVLSEDVCDLSPMGSHGTEPESALSACPAIDEELSYGYPVTGPNGETQYVVGDDENPPLDLPDWMREECQ